MLHIEVNNRSVKCRHCQEKIVKDGLKIFIIKSSKKDFYHPTCFFRWLQESGSDLDIPNVNVFTGIEGLDQSQNQRLNDLFAEYNRNKTVQNIGGCSQSASNFSAQDPFIKGSVLNTSSIIKSQDMGNIVNSCGLIPSPSQTSISQPTAIIRNSSISSSVSKGSSVTINHAPHISVISDDDCDAPSTSKRGLETLTANLTSTPKRQRINQEETKDETLCSICLDPPVHPVKLPCNHVYCYLCAKGLVFCDSMQASPQCSLCRQNFHPSHLESSIVLKEASATVNDTPPIDVDALDTDQDIWQWFYQGNKGWWRFEERQHDDIEQSYLQGAQSTELLICGRLYTIDFVRMEQFPKNYPGRKRQIKRDLRSSSSKGVAGLVKSSSRN